MQRRAGQAAAVDQRRVIELVAEDRGAARRERAGQAEIRHVAGREDECPFAPGESREFLLERLMLRLVTGDQVRGARADAVHARGADEGLDDLRMRGKPQVIIAAEIDARAAVEFDVCGPGRAAARGATPPAEAAGVEFRKRRAERQGFGSHGHPVATEGSGRIPSRPNRA